MEVTREQMKQEALSRIDTLIKIGLNPNVSKYFKEDRLYYSYLTGSGFIGSIDTINYDERYVKVVKDVERMYDCLVYHAIESGNSLALLFVSHKESNWETERLYKNELMAYVHNFDDPQLSEIGYISIDSYQGALVRIG